MRIALASVEYPINYIDGLKIVRESMRRAANSDCRIICFPESYFPGYGAEPYSMEKLMNIRNKVASYAKDFDIAVIMPMDWYDRDRLINVAFVIDNQGEVMGYQPKVQLDKSEEGRYLPGDFRRVFEYEGLTFGIAICHEGFRYPETVRYAAVNGAKIVFHPHFAGDNLTGEKLTVWGDISNPYYEKAMIMRSMENSIYFASVNYCMTYQDSATSIISPDGECVGFIPYGKSDILMADIEEKKANAFLANRYKDNNIHVKFLDKSEDKMKAAEEVLYDLNEWFEVEEDIREYIENSNMMPFVAAYSYNMPVGFLAIRETSKSAAQIYVMGVKKRFQRNGIGKMLLRECVEYCKSRGYTYIQVKTVDEYGENTAYDKTRRYYEAMGFTPIESTKEILINNNPCLIMIKKVN